MLRNWFARDNKSNVIFREIRLTSWEQVVRVIWIKSYHCWIKLLLLWIKLLKMIWLSLSLMSILRQPPLSLCKVCVTSSTKILKYLSSPKNQDPCKRFKISGHMPRRIYWMLSLYQELNNLERIKSRLFLKETFKNWELLLKNPNLKKKRSLLLQKQLVACHFGSEQS